MRILLVDDEQRLRTTIARSLVAHGYRVLESGTARDAIALMQSQPVDFLLLDINLPDATGWDVLRTMGEKGIAVRTVIFSAAPPSRVRIAEFTPFGVLHKPFPIDALLSLIERSAASQTDDARIP